jgi:hypothetical protein
MSTTLSRRVFAAGSVATILGGATVISLPAVRTVVAQAGTDLTSLGLPTIDITVTADALEGAPAELEAGRYLVTATLGEGVDYGSPSFIMPPSGMAAEDFLAESGLGGGKEPAPSPVDVASPVVEGEGGEEGPPPTIAYQAHFAGGAVLYAEQQADWAGQAVIDLGPGEWILWSGEPGSPQPPVIFTVTGEMPADVPEPDADIDVTFIDFGIAVEGTLTAGEHLMRIENLGAQPHFLVLEKGPDDMTNEQIDQILEFFLAMETGEAVSPEALPFDPEADLMPLLDTAVQSIGVVNWVPVSLDAGTYVMLCFFPTAGEGLPHAYHGMHTVFTVT